MGKRSDFIKKARGFYPTPRAAVAPILPYLIHGDMFVEPCAGDGALIDHLESFGMSCVQASDIHPMRKDIAAQDCLSDDFYANNSAEWIITNPPWPLSGKRGDPALSIIKHLMALKMTWVLLPWDFAANLYFSEVRANCVRVVPIGRVSWQGNGVPGKDNCAWYLFDIHHKTGPIIEARAA